LEARIPWIGVANDVRPRLPVLGVGGDEAVEDRSSPAVAGPGWLGTALRRMESESPNLGRRGHDSGAGAGSWHRSVSRLPWTVGEIPGRSVGRNRSSLPRTQYARDVCEESA